MNFDEFKEKFDSFLSGIPDKEVVDEFRRLGCPVEEVLGGNIFQNEERGSFESFDLKFKLSDLDMPFLSTAKELRGLNEINTLKKLSFCRKKSDGGIVADSYFQDEGNLSLAA